MIQKINKYGHMEVKLKYIKNKLIKFKCIRKDKWKKCILGDQKKLKNKRKEWDGFKGKKIKEIR